MSYSSSIGLLSGPQTATRDSGLSIVTKGAAASGTSSALIATSSRSTSTSGTRFAGVYEYYPSRVATPASNESIDQYAKLFFSKPLNIALFQSFARAPQERHAEVDLKLNSFFGQPRQFEEFVMLNNFLELHKIQIIQLKPIKIDTQLLIGPKPPTVTQKTLQETVAKAETRYTNGIQEIEETKQSAWVKTIVAVALAVAVAVICIFCWPLSAMLITLAALGAAASLVFGAIAVMDAIEYKNSNPKLLEDQFAPFKAYKENPAFRAFLENRIKKNTKNDLAFWNNNFAKFTNQPAAKPTCTIEVIN